MVGCRTNCIERPLSQGFQQLGIIVARYPWWFLCIPFIISAGLGAGFYFLPQRQANNIEKQFTPIGGPAKTERDFIKKHFPTNDSGHFSPQRLYTEGSFVSLIAVSLSDNILHVNAFRELLLLDEMVRSLNITRSEQGHNVNLSFQQLCAEVQGPRCFPPNPLVAAVQDNPDQIEILNVTYPLFQNGTFLGMYVGGVTLGPEHTVQKALAIRLVYYIREDSDQDRHNSLLWINHFITSIPLKINNLKLKHIQVSYYTSVSMQQEFEVTTRSVIPLYSVTYFLTIFFSITTCTRFDCVRNKVWVASFGVITSGLAVLSSFGLLLLCGVPFVVTAANAPFLILGVGVDDMFIMISSWQQTDVMSSVEKRMANTYKEAAVSITITTLTDVLAFYIGIMTTFGSVQSFCIYTGTAILFCFIYNITCFGAFLSLHGRREESNRHWFTCIKVKKPGDGEGFSLYRACCVGGEYDRETSKEIEHPVTGFFRNKYGPFITNIWTKAFIIALYFVYVASSLYGCFQVQEGIDLRNLATDSSYVIPFYDKEDAYFSIFGPRVMVAITEETSYWDSSVRSKIETCMEAFENNSFVNKSFSESWLRVYEKFKPGIDDKNDFIANLTELFRAFPNYEQDLYINSNTIKASRFFIQTVNVITAVDEKDMLNQLREIAKSCEVPVLVYNPIFIYFDQYAVIVQNTVQNILVAAAAMFVISILLIPNPLCVLWVTFAIASIIVGVTGFMAYWQVNLDSISMINLVICIGFSVDFSAHISYAYVSNGSPKANSRVADALHSLGYPILQGGLSTILGVVVLSTAESYIFRTFFKIIFLVITFGMLHGLVFLPVFLTLFGNCDRKCRDNATGNNSNNIYADATNESNSTKCSDLQPRAKDNGSHIN
ncbi:patched domain-containing protein 3-like [Pelobates fuscus]|uniref:patched domain-containing protein 3-like n=1 Tax=Pelobates fuscus TaxID=191477 RepID=UPI002FE4A2FA